MNRTKKMNNKKMNRTKKINNKKMNRTKKMNNKKMNRKKIKCLLIIASNGLKIVVKILIK